MCIRDSYGTRRPTWQYPSFGRPAARMCRSIAADNPQWRASGPWLPLFFNHVLEHGLVQGQFCDQFLQTCILVLELTYLPDLIHLQTSIGLLPTIERLLTDA